MEKKQKKQVTIIIVLLAVLAAVWYVVLFGPPTGGPDPAPPPGNDRPDPEIAEVAPEPDTIEKEDPPESETPDVPDDEAIRTLIMHAARHLETHDIDMRADALERAEEKRLAGDFELSAILWSEDDPLALINGRMVSVGGKAAENVTVIDIRTQSVILSIHIDDEAAETILLQLEP